MEEFTPYFTEVPDPRARNARHDFLEVIFAALAAVLCGAEDCTNAGAVRPPAGCATAGGES